MEKMGINLSKDSKNAPLWIDQHNMRVLRGDPEPEPEKPNPLEYSWKNTGPPVWVFVPKSKEDEELNWTVPNPAPDKYYSDRGKSKVIDTRSSGRYFIIDDPPQGSSALAIFQMPRGQIGRFIDDTMKDELIKKWEERGVKIVIK